MLDEPVEPRQWLLGNVLCRDFVTVLAASGGTGKTSLMLAWYLSLASGRALIDVHVHKRCRVLILVFEDGREEIKRRLKAACMHYGIGADDIRGYLKVITLTGRGETLAISDNGEMREGDLPGSIELLIEEHKIDVVSFDPFVKCSGAPENDNASTDFVCRILSRIAETKKVAVAIAHHTRKGASDPGNIDSARGASALIDAARIGLTLTSMDSGSAKDFGINENERRTYSRLDDGKTNLTVAEKAKWFKMASVNLGNGTEDYPYGDNVQAIEPWTPPDAWADLNASQLNRMLDDIRDGLDDGERYSAAPNAKDRAAWKVVHEHAPGKSDAQCRQIIKTWLKNDVLIEEKYRSPLSRKEVSGLSVNDEKRPGGSPE
ncbi:MAG: AAA family ATPase [Hyphomicrobiales bacterium]|nr:AAA family ATPase [Hyphomicrobiales bacterium]